MSKASFISSSSMLDDIMNDSSDEGGALVDSRPKTSSSSKSKPVKVAKPTGKAAPAPAKGTKRAREILPVVAAGIDEGDDEEDDDDDEDGEINGEGHIGGGMGGRRTVTRTQNIFYKSL